MRALAAGVLLTLGGFSSAVSAQAEPPKPTVKEERTAEARAALQKALDESKASGKVLLVTFGTDPGRARANEQMLSVPATAAWVSRHALTHAVSDVELVRELTPEGLKQTAGMDPLFFVNGVIAPLGSSGSSIVLANSPRADPRSPAGQGSITMAMRLDWTLRAPLFKQDFTKQQDAATKPIPWPGTGDGKPAGLLAKLNGARALAQQKKWDEAANAYANAWWDAGGSVVNAPIKVGAMAAEMALIAQQSPGARDRFTGLRQEYARAMDIRDMRQLHEYLILCRVLGDHELNLRFLDEATQSKAATLEVPASDSLAIDWMLPVCHWNDPTEGVSKPAAWCVQLVHQCDKMAARKDGPSLSSAIDYGRWLARVEASRRLAWLLISGRDGPAVELRDAVVAADASPELKLAMVATALASGQKRPWMSDFIKGLEADDLRQALEK